MLNVNLRRGFRRGCIDRAGLPARSSDESQMQGYDDRSKYRAVVGTKYARELILK
jgi:hypothetical protein